MSLFSIFLLNVLPNFLFVDLLIFMGSFLVAVLKKSKLRFFPLKIKSINQSEFYIPII